MRSLGVLLACIALAMSGCGSVDQFGERINDSNSNSQNSLNDETLLNILRAQGSEPLNFVGISQISGGQTEALSTGLPTEYLGPAPVASMRIHSITNSVSSTVTGGYQDNPLVSTDFENGVLGPTTLRSMALLTSDLPREVVFFASIDSLTIRSVAGRGEVVRLSNDPADDSSTDERLHTDYESCERYVRNASSGRSPSGSKWLVPGERCSYSKFANLLKTLISLGLTYELTSGTPSTNDKDPAAFMARGHLCFDPGQASLDEQRKVISSFYPLCARATGKPAAATKDVDQLGFDVDGVGPSVLSVDYRSLDGIYKYLGEVTRDGLVVSDYYSLSALRMRPKGFPYLHIHTDPGADCFANVQFRGASYCVAQGDRHAAALFDLLQKLRNLNIKPSDLNSAFTVRVQN